MVTHKNTFAEFSSAYYHYVVNNKILQSITVEELPSLVEAQFEKFTKQASTKSEPEPESVPENTSPVS